MEIADDEFSLSLSKNISDVKKLGFKTYMKPPYFYIIANLSEMVSKGLGERGAQREGLCMWRPFSTLVGSRC